MWTKITSLAGSWKTTASGVALAMCGGTGLADEINPFLPERMRLALHAFCLLCVVFGLLAAKDFNKTNAIVATSVPQTVPVSPPAPDQVVVKQELQN